MKKMGKTKKRLNITKNVFVKEVRKSQEISLFLKAETINLQEK